MILKWFHQLGNIIRISLIVNNTNSKFYEKGFFLKKDGLREIKIQLSPFSINR